MINSKNEPVMFGTIGLDINSIQLFGGNGNCLSFWSLNFLTWPFFSLLTSYTNYRNKVIFIKPNIHKTKIKISEKNLV
jgi:hypothetical protein